MLDNNTLSQLTQLKSDILASKEFAEGTVVGTTGRFGFVRTEDGRDAFLSPDKMEKLLPGDKVKVSLTKNKDNKLEATLEKLLECPTDRFIGTYKVKGKAHFVVPSIDGFNRWIFIPPQARAKCKEDDLIVAKITRHPLDDGRAQAKVLERIGQADEDRIELKFTKAKFDLNREFGHKEQAQVKEIEKKFSQNGYAEERQVISDIPYVTIDSQTTRDMDDAIALTTEENNGEKTYTLHVAIADPAEVIEQGSPLARTSQIRSQTVYMLGGAVPMLPTTLSNQYLSLEEGKERLALTCEHTINAQGEITNSSFGYAKIVSKHKLCYDDVADFIEQENTDAIPADVQSMIQDLYALAQLRHDYRVANNMIGPEQMDYDYQLSFAGKIESVKAKPKNAAHRVVEEAMVATNIAAGNLLAEHNIGLAIINEGFRKDRIGEVKALLKEEEITPEGDIETLEGFSKLIKSLEQSADKAYFLQPLRRMMQFGHPSLEHSPHMGMGVAHYATVTSPIRRYVDLYNHWALKQVLTGKAIKNLSENHLELLNESLQKGKKAERELFQWLIVQYVEGQVGREAHGKVRIVTQQGFGVKIDEDGIEGFVLYTKKTPKQFDAKRMTLTVNDSTYKLDQTVKIKITGVDLDKRRIAFEICE